MDSKQLQKVTADLKTKYPKAGIRRIEVDEETGKSTFFLSPSESVLAALPNNEGVRPRIATAATIRRDFVTRQDLDLAKRSVFEEDAREIFTRAMKYYYEFDVYGSHIDILSNFASKGFENATDDDDIKLFYDTWNFDVNFKQLLDWIFFDFFRVGMVRTYKIIGKYEPGVSYLSPAPGQKRTKKEKGVLSQFSERASRIHANKMKKLDEMMSNLDGRKTDHKKLKMALAQRKKVWSKGYMPIAYTVLNPLNVTIEGSLLFDKSKVTLEPSAELKELLKKPPSELTDDEKLILKLLPSDFKTDAEKGNIELDPLFVGAVDYRKQPYERYAKPRGVKAFDSLEYKNALREADLSTLDGITNYILKVTIGNDEYPCTDQSQLETVSQLFNTPSKSFDVVWNHTLEIEKIVAPEIEAVLGQDKYQQVNEDISGAIAMSRALIDGTTNVNTGEAGLIVKTVIEEINYARRQVESWIYNEYRQIAEAIGFDQFPKVRWDNTILRDIILYMSTISQLVDRRMLSYETALEELGFDYPNEFGNMQNELPDVLKGVLGILGSPFQQARQPVQGGPKRTPSAGRPRGQPAKKKQPNTNTQTKTKVPNQAPSQQPSATTQGADISIKNVITKAAEVLDEDQFKAFLEGISIGLKSDENE
jgi:hypothetical protein